MIKKKPLFLIALFFLLLIGVVYHNLPKTFFQQDEWAAFGGIISRQTAGPLQAAKSFSLQWEGVHFTPLTNFIIPLKYHLFGLNFAPYAFLSIGLHALNTFLVFYLTYLLLKKLSLSFAVGLLFAVNSIFHQPVTWIASSFNTQSCYLFLLLTLIFLAKYILDSKNDRRLVFASVLALAISLGFKEATVFLFIVLPVFWLIFSPKRNWFSLKKTLSPFFILGLFYFGLRIFLLLNIPPILPKEIASLTQPPKHIYFYRLFFLSFRIIPQSLISTGQIVSWAEKLVYFVYPHYFVTTDGVANPFVVETIAFDFICFFLFIVISFFSYFLYRFLEKSGERQMVKGFLFAFALIVASAFPLIFIPGKAGYSSIVEPRHLYITGVGSSLLLGIVIFTFSRWLALKIEKVFKFKKGILTYVLILAFLGSVLFLHVRNIWRDIDKLVINSQIRKSILSQIKNSYPHLPEEVVFYTESDTAYYGLPDEEKILPFQSGFGQTLLVWYHAHGEKFPLCMFVDFWLYQIEEQGYQFCQGRGFGYFRKYEDLVAGLKENDLSPENVIAYRFNSEDNSLTDISLEVSSKLK